LGIEGYQNRSQFGQAEPAGDPFRTVGEHDRHVISLSDAKFPENPAEPVAERVQLPVGQMAVVKK
jgi:hypothetical protein